MSVFSYSISSAGEEFINIAMWLMEEPLRDLSVLKLHESSSLLSHTPLGSIFHLTLKFEFLLKLSR